MVLRNQMSTFHAVIGWHNSKGRLYMHEYLSKCVYMISAPDSIMREPLSIKPC